MSLILVCLRVGKSQKYGCDNGVVKVLDGVRRKSVKGEGTTHPGLSS